MRLIRHVVIALAATACTSSLSDFSSASGGSFGPDETSVDAAVPFSSIPNVGACPASAPQQGNSCDAPSTPCEYGDEALPACDDVFVCDLASGNAWRRRDGGPAVCNVCPTQYTELPPDGACTHIGAICTYYEATCGCMGAADAGDSDAGAGTWSCTRPALGCPARRPRLGESCVHEMTCDYGSCLFGAALAFACAHVDSQTVAWTATDPPVCP